MKENKFRGIDIDDDTWKYGYLVKNGDRCFIFTGELNTTGLYPTWDRVEVIPKTVGQFIRLHDKAGTEIYEGDKITKFGMPTPECDSTVVYCNGAFGYIADKYTGFVSFAQNYHFNWIDNKSDQIEIVGNIYEQEELKQ